MADSVVRVRVRVRGLEDSGLVTTASPARLNPCSNRARGRLSEATGCAQRECGARAGAVPCAAGRGRSWDGERDPLLFSQMLTETHSWFQGRRHRTVWPGAERLPRDSHSPTTD